MADLLNGPPRHLERFAPPTGDAMSIGPTCPACSHIHTSTDARGVDRFAPTPHVYRADFPGAPLRPTRAEAVADMCRRRQEAE